MRAPPFVTLRIKVHNQLKMSRFLETLHQFTSRRNVLALRRAVGRGIEILRYGLARPCGNRHFHIVSAQRNMGDAALKCLDSVYSQRYPREFVRHIFIDDASDDETPAVIESWLKNHPGHSVEFIRNSERRGMLANNLSGFALGGIDDIGFELNGDDWLPDPGVLRFYNQVYADDAVWMTYNTHRRISGEIPLPLAPKRRVAADRSFRTSPWATSAPHTFRVALHRHLRAEDLNDPETGNPWEFSQDQAVYLPMLEMAGSHSKHIYRVTLIYNFHGQSDESRDRPAQLETTRRIREYPTYPLVTSLDHSGVDFES